MPWAKVTPVMLECPPGDLCRRRHPGHTKGCPNFGTRTTCPPHAEIWTPEFFAGFDIYAIWNRFDFGGHVDRMRDRHPTWSERQLACCLYWQGTARKRLGEYIEAFEYECVKVGHKRPSVSRIPEAHGVNVTETMAMIGVELEWPPNRWTYQVALAFVKKGKA